jgi:hypothetical protein
MFKKMEDNEYFAYKAISSHNIMSFFFPQDYPKQDPKLFEVGTYVHAKVLESTEIAEEIIKTRCKSLDQDDISKSDKMVESLQKSTKIKKKLYLEKDYILTEMAAIKDIKTPSGEILKVKGKFDLINVRDKYVLDVKTTSNLKTFHDSVEKFAYHIQAAFYLRLARSVTKEEYNDFYWAVVDKKTLSSDLIRCSDDLIKKGNHYVDLYFKNIPTYHF